MTSEQHNPSKGWPTDDEIREGWLKHHTSDGYLNNTFADHCLGEVLHKEPEGRRREPCNKPEPTHIIRHTY